MKAVPHKSWKSLVENSDATLLWQSLHRLVSIHPLVRSAQRNQHNSKNAVSLLSLQDLTQDLYLLLLEKSRFKHYVQGQMTDAEIEREIFQVELTNMLIGRLRRRQPENYRIVRRISAVLESGPCFRVIRQPEAHQPARYRQAVNVVYGLRNWNLDKPIQDSGTFENLIANIPMRIRNRRRVGCKGDSQIIVTNQELSELLVEIFQAIDSPASLRVLRTLALSKLPVYDAVVSSIEQVTEQDEYSRGWEKLLISTNSCPEQINLRREQEMLARRAAHDFLARLDRITRFQHPRTQKLWQILWYYYFDPTEPSQLSIAAMLGMSDSSVSDYRRKMEQEMQKLLRPTFSPEQMSYFAEELATQLKRQLARLEETRWHKPKEQQESAWPRFNYASLASMEAIPVV
ncbi:MAG: hypothetical protein JST84_32570 [Acidobacteria bacterium]|nr:hypothetical protein [Acidobacteriota bacterium]